MARRRRPVRQLAGALTFAWLGFVCAALSGAGASPFGPTTTTAAQEQKPAGATPKKDPIAKLSEPWREPEELAKRRVEAEALPLFNADDPLPFTLRADFSAINGDRTPDSDKRFPGVLEVKGAGGEAHAIPVTLSSRGHSRLNIRTCEAVPLRVDFAKKDVKDTVFEGQDELKLVTHCHNDGEYEQYVLGEHLSYRLYRVFTPRSFRTRLARVTYVDTKRNKTTGPRYGMFLERDEDVARRLEGRLYPLQKRLFRQLDTDALTVMAVLQYMLGNTDYSISALHNVKLVQDRAGAVYPIAYDFDYSGLVNTRYAVADKRLQLSTVRDRLYRGPCRTLEELDPLLASFRAKKAEAMAMVDQVPDLKP